MMAPSPEDKVRENRLRRVAARRGRTLSRSGRRDPLAIDYGVYWLDDMRLNDLDAVERELSLPPVEEAGDAVSEFLMWEGATGFDTTGCNCGHDRLGVAWHLNTCQWPARAYRRKALELAKRLDEVHNARS